MGRNAATNVSRLGLGLGLLFLGCGARSTIGPLDAAPVPDDASSCGRDYADTLVIFQPSTPGSDPSLGSRALGAADGQSVDVTVDAALTVGFADTGGVIDDPGDDFRVIATFSSGAQASVYAADAVGMSFRYAGTIEDGHDTIDLATATLRAAVYLKIVGLSGDVAIDAISALHPAGACAGD
jgi:hypothetical protein